MRLSSQRPVVSFGMGGVDYRPIPDEAVERAWARHDGVLGPYADNDFEAYDLLIRHLDDQWLTVRREQVERELARSKAKTGR